MSVYNENNKFKKKDYIKEKKIYMQAIKSR